MNPHPIYRTIGALIRARRKALDMTQDHLATALGISRGSLANIEAGRQAVLAHQLYDYASKLDLHVHDLLPEQTASLPPLDWAAIPLPDDLKPSQREALARMLSEPIKKQKASKGGI